MFTNAIVKKPSKAIIEGITSVDLGKPLYDKAVLQHNAYVAALQQGGLQVLVLPADNNFPDSTFVEDVALCTPKGLIVTRPGAITRQGETAGILPTLQNNFTIIGYVKAPGTVEAGDVMVVNNTYYIGLSARTNTAGFHQLVGVLTAHGFEAVAVPLQKVLHLKTGVSYLDNNNLLVSGEFVAHEVFSSFNKIIVDSDEAYAANALFVNGKVLLPKGYPKVQAKIAALGYEIISLDMSEFQKVDGGLSCLSLRY